MNPDQNEPEQSKQPSSADVDLISALLNTGRHDEAERLARSILANHPEVGRVWKLLCQSLHLQGKNILNDFRKSAELNAEDAEAYFMLGFAQHDQGLLRNSVESFLHAIKIRRDFSEAHYHLGNVLKELGQFYDAMTSYRQALKAKPEYAEAHNGLGTLLKSMGLLDAALDSFDRALKIKPDFAGAHVNRGDILRDSGRHDEAMESYRRAMDIDPEFAEAHSSLASVFKELGQLDKALASCNKAIEVNHRLADAHNNLGVVFKELGQLQAATESFSRAIEINPDFHQAHSNLGDVLQALGKQEEAKSSYRRALQQKHLLAEAYNKQGSALFERQQLVGAIASFRCALALNADYAKAHSNLGSALRELGQLELSRASLLRAAALQTDSLHHAINANLLLPVIPASSMDIVEWRERYENGIAALMEMPGVLNEPGEKLNSVSFYLAYHNKDDRPLMESLGRMFRKRMPDLTFTAPHVSSWKTPVETGRRIRIGFLSEFLYDHTIGKHYQGFIHYLDRSRFEVVLIHGNKSRRDAFRQKLDESADKAITLPANLKSQQRAVAAEQLDVLFYPDIGMSASAYFLAFSRLAPIQATSWGHPDTSGLDTIDYYLSAATNETETADANYTERLVRLNRLPCFYYQTPTSYIPKISKASLGLPEKGTLYGCPQSLFKIHPDFDRVLADIAEGDPAGYIILPGGKYAAWTDLLKARWARTFPILLERVIFMPRMLWGPFLTLMQHTDVLLDPLYFGSGNTMYDAMLSGTPMVTWPGQFARGRNVAAAYHQLGVTDAPVVSCLEDYAPLALALGNDPERRLAMRQASVEAAHKELFEDRHAVKDFGDFLEAAVNAANRGNLLPSEWRPAL